MGNTVSSFIHKAATFVKDTVVNVFRRIAPPIVRYVAAHPIRSFFHVVNFIVLLVPGIVTAPLLALAGFTSSGVAAGSLAACIQSAVGAVQAGGTFAVLQSAAVSMIVIDHIMGLTDADGRIRCSNDCKCRTWNCCCYWSCGSRWTWSKTLTVKELEPTRSHFSGMPIFTETSENVRTW
ncbi:hypothetical protein BKA66DRAFT_439447 [Pyrenochaeta sp. MPI-SDFR-AT-0127]|nr:hypothetical protein BKA66DRAFT_439447 [Pyrenochaeta sp. MPI-SDFR-AT-0127]